MTTALSGSAAAIPAAASFDLIDLPRPRRSPCRGLLLEDVHADALATLRSAGVEVQASAAAMDEDELIHALQDVHVLGIRSRTQISARVLDAAPQLRAIGAFCIGTSQIDLHAATRHGVAVFNAPFSNTRSVVELAIGEIIALHRRLRVRDEDLHGGTWDKSAVGSHEIRGRALGIVGYGSIGSQLSVVAEALGMSVLFYDCADRLPLGNARRCSSLEELLAASDVVSLHVDGRPENANLIGEEQLLLMRPGSYLLNLSRGHVVDMAALRRQLLTGHLAGAAIDVHPSEPRRAGEAFDSPLRGLPNVLLTPHIGGSTLEAQQDIACFVARKLARYVSDGATQMSVNLPQLTSAATPRTTRLAVLSPSAPDLHSQVGRVLATSGVSVHALNAATRDGSTYLLADCSTTSADPALRTTILNLQAILPPTARVELRP